MSHNTMANFFSGGDDNDEISSRLFAVFGKLNTQEVGSSWRAGVNGNFIPLILQDIVDTEDLLQNEHTVIPEGSIDKISAISSFGSFSLGDYGRRASHMIPPTRSPYTAASRTSTTPSEIEDEYLLRNNHRNNFEYYNDYQPEDVFIFDDQAGVDDGANALSGNAKLSLVNSFVDDLFNKFEDCCSDFISGRFSTHKYASITGDYIALGNLLSSNNKDSLIKFAGASVFSLYEALEPDEFHEIMDKALQGTEFQVNYIDEMEGNVHEGEEEDTEEEAVIGAVSRLCAASNGVAPSESFSEDLFSDKNRMEEAAQLLTTLEPGDHDEPDEEIQRGEEEKSGEKEDPQQEKEEPVEEDILDLDPED